MSKRTRASVMTAYPYKLIAIKACKETGLYFVEFEIVGQSQLGQCSPEWLLKEDALVSGFSPLDIRDIGNHLREVSRRGVRKIVGYDLAQHPIDTVFHVAEKRGRYILKKTLAELARDKTLLKGFSAEDAYRVGYFCGLSSASPD